MNSTRVGLSLAILVAALASSAWAQQAGAPVTLTVTPDRLELRIGETANLTATVQDASGAAVERRVIFITRDRRAVGVSPEGEVEARIAGDYILVAMVPADPEETSRRAEPLLQVEIPVTVVDPPVTELVFRDVPPTLYAETVIRLHLDAIDELGGLKKNAAIAYAVDDASVASVDEFGQIRLHAPGRATLTASVGAARATLSLEVRENPVAEITLTPSMTTANTGDVVRFTAMGRDAARREVEHLPIHFAVAGFTAPNIIAAGSTAQIEPDGRFVAERSGQYTIIATSGGQAALHRINITPRKVWRRIEVLGQGAVRDRHTSDLWVWEGPDGGDYAITGTWGADGHAYIWDVTDPANITMIDTVKVDARTVNDVKVSEDGRIAVLSREGASNRRNGLVILDVSDPKRGVRKIGEYDDELTGGVHNVFIDGGHVYALSAGRRYDIINIENPYEPYRVGQFELGTPGHSIHDVWVENGIAYSSNWSDGVVAVDVGGGDAGGSPERPVMLGQYAYPNGANHAAFPFRSQSTGKFYLVAGDESFPYGDPNEGEPERAAGWIHFIEWDDWDRPREVARYQAPEAGTHNLWIEDDVLYIAYYDGGLRVVDISGELLGDLYRQGREIARFYPEDPKGFVKNAPMVWGPQPHKGTIFIADHNSGLWALRLVGEPTAQPGLLEDR